jgi:PAB1-binding protein PBP1
VDFGATWTGATLTLVRRARDDSELTKAREESAKWKRGCEESITRLQRAEEERNEVEHKAYSLEVDVEEKGAEIAELQKSKERLLKDIKSKEEEIEAQKKWNHKNQPSEAAQKLEEVKKERDEAVSSCWAAGGIAHLPLRTCEAETERACNPEADGGRA